MGKPPSKDGKHDDSETPTFVVLCNLRIVPECVYSSGDVHASALTLDILISDRQIVAVVELVWYYWMVSPMANVFQVELDVAQGTEVYDVSVQMAVRKNRQP